MVIKINFTDKIGYYNITKVNQKTYTTYTLTCSVMGVIYTTRTLPDALRYLQGLDGFISWGGPNE